MPSDLLTDSRVKNARPKPRPYKLFDGKGLFMLVTPTGSKYWRLKYRIHDKEKLLALGVYSDVTLAEARAKRDEARKSIAAQKDPVHERRREKLVASVQAANTFEAIADEWIGKKAITWSKKYKAKVETMLANNLFPVIGKLPIAEINAPVLLAAIKPVESRGSLEIAERCRRYASEIFRYAIATGRAERDWAADLKGAVVQKPVEHYAALPRDQLGKLLVDIDNYDGSERTRIGLQLLALLFPRTIELRAARWSEFDLKARVWSVPAERMKMRRPHLVPLSRQAIALLRTLHKITGESEFLFPNERNPRTHISENTLLYAIYRIGYHQRMTGHGFRACASTILNDEGKFRHEVIERSLAHVISSASSRPYNRAEYWPERVKLMQHWADLLDTLRKQASGKQ